LQQCTRETENGLKRRAQLVTHIGEKGLLRGVGRFEFEIGLDELLGAALHEYLEIVSVLVQLAFGKHSRGRIEHAHDDALLGHGRRSECEHPQLLDAHDRESSGLDDPLGGDLGERSWFGERPITLYEHGAARKRVLGGLTKKLPGALVAELVGARSVHEDDSCRCGVHDRSAEVALHAQFLLDPHLTSQATCGRR